MIKKTIYRNLIIKKIIKDFLMIIVVNKIMIDYKNKKRSGNNFGNIKNKKTKKSSIRNH